MRTYRMNRKEFADFRDVQIKPKAGWPASFSCNAKGEVWPRSRSGFHQQEDRIQMKGHIPMLDNVVDDVLEASSVLPKGGRFDLNDAGAFLTESGIQVSRFVVK